MDKKDLKKDFFINRDISWLHFNDRVLQEAQNPEVPIIERIRFLGIFSNNLDEFFRVRVATIKRMVTWGKRATTFLHLDPNVLLDQIHDIVVKQQSKFDRIYKKLFKELEREGIFMLDDKTLNEKQLDFAHTYFLEKVRPSLVPIMLNLKLPVLDLKDMGIYLAIKLYNKKDKSNAAYALIEVPSEDQPRIVVLPKDGNDKYIILLEDIIRLGLKDIFAAFQYECVEAYTIKNTKDAELDISEDIAESFMNKISQSLQNRKQGQTVRFIYDDEMPEDLLNFLIKKNKLKKGDNLISGGRYHNFKDFINFPDVGSAKLHYSNLPPLDHPDFKNEVSLLKVIRKKDVLLHFPFQSFHYVIDILREAAINPNVTSIKMTIYRVADKSRIVNALINAAKNGKNVTVVIELQARFDEENNIQWSRKLQEEGLRVIFGVSGLKVHSKLILIKERIGKKNILYAHVGTGNFHEGTAKIYTDMSLFTCEDSITNEVQKVFQFFKDNYRRSTYRQLVVSPTSTRRNFLKMISHEIKNARKGEDAYIIIKINNMVDEEMIQKLYDASNAGVIIQLIVRGTCAIVPGIINLSENITVTSIIDRFLEHTRILVFCNGGNEKQYISSADWMSRNLDNRIEVSAPILDKRLQKQIREVLNIYLKDNVKARIVDINGNNKFVSLGEGKVVRSQIEVYKYYKSMLD